MQRRLNKGRKRDIRSRQTWDGGEAINEVAFLVARPGNNGQGERKAKKTS